MVQKWPVLKVEPLGDFRIFQIRRERKRSPRTGAEHDFFVLDCPGWVNVIALTPDRQIVLVEQYRHGTDTVDLEIPGGVMDPHDPSPIATGERELREETGYAGRHARILATVATNPAFMTNRCYTVLIEDCTRQHEVQFDHSEDIVTRIVPLRDIPQLVREERMPHSLVQVALCRLMIEFPEWFK